MCPTLAAAVNKDGNVHLLKADDLSTRNSETAAHAAPLQSLQLDAADNPDSSIAGGILGVPAYWPSGNMLFVTDNGPGFTDGTGTHVNAGVVGLNLTPAPTCTLQVAWSVNWWKTLSLDGQPPTSPTVANGVVFVGSGVNGSVHAFDATSGTDLWNSGGAIPGGATFAAPMVANGVLYTASWNSFGASGGTIRAFGLGQTASCPPPPAVLLGDQAIESQRDDNKLGLAEAFQTTASACGTVTSLSIYLDSSSTVTKLFAGLYADASGHPGALMAQGSNSAALTAGAWNKITIPGGIVTAGQPYWLAILGTNSGLLRFRDGKGGCLSETSAQSNLTSLPSSWATGAIYSSCPASGYGSSGP
jgi:hypothetical protein